MSDAPVLLIGGTRGTGLLIAHSLVQEGLTVRVLARAPDRAARQLGPAPEIVFGDITKAATLFPALAGVRAIIFTAGCRSGRPVGRAQVRRTEYEGVLHTLDAANRTGFNGRFLYMTASGVGMRSFWTLALNLYKGNTLLWRKRAEDAIRASGLPYTIIRTAVLTNQAAGTRPIRLTQRPLPLSPRYRIARADVAAGFVAALEHPQTVRSTFELVWDRKSQQLSWDKLFDCVEPDQCIPSLA